MFIQIAPKVKVYVTDDDLEFIKAHSSESFRSNQLSPENILRVRRLADKAIFVRKKLDNDMQYQINRKIRIMYDSKRSG
jgi:ribosomal protein S13